jgi:hypothetical protein
MKILSFDVGIVNLACCIIEKIENNEPKILQKRNDEVVSESSPRILLDSNRKK